MLTDLPCPKANFSKAELSDAKLSGATLTETSFVEAVVRNADFTKADLSGAVLQGADLTAADLSGADLTGTKFAGALNLRAATFDNLRGAILDGLDLTGVDLSGADLTGTKFAGALNLRAATFDNLRGAILDGVDLTGANLGGKDLSGADLTGVDLSGKDLSGVNLSGASVTGTNFSGVLNLSTSNFDCLCRAACIQGLVYVDVSKNLNGTDFVGGSLLAGPDIRSNSVITSLARLASGCMTISVRFGTGGDDDQYLGVLARNLNGESYSRMREQNAWSVKHLSQPFADGIAVTKAQVAWSLKGQDIKMVVDASAGRVSFHSAASGQTVVMDGLPKGELWLAVGLYQNSATVLAVDVPAAPPAAQ